MVYFNLELTFKAVHDDIEMQFTHSRNNRLAGFLVGTNSESRIFFSQFGESNIQFIDIVLGFGFHSHADNRLGETH